jgi:peptide methionine sulfoxide reductase msrA/msrB
MSPKALVIIGLAAGLAAWNFLSVPGKVGRMTTVRDAQNGGERTVVAKINRSNEEWRKILPAEQYHILRERGTEQAFRGRYNDHYQEGLYVCAACGNPLFRSGTKYDHGSGWPSFTAPVGEEAVLFVEDHSYLMNRTEVRCAACGSHLGHVFDDGPAPTGRHYCINSASLDFKQAGAETSAALEARTETVTLAAGCFWGVEDKFRRVPGVLSAVVGYTGGTTANPIYGQVCSDRTGHAESVQIAYDPSRVSYEELVRFFFSIHDPTQLNRQGPDVGNQYRSAVFTNSPQQAEIAQRIKTDLEASGRFSRPIVTQIVPASTFYPAEEYHQRYLEKLRRRTGSNTGGCGTDTCGR